jgi:hypothetical protein
MSGHAAAARLARLRQKLSRRLRRAATRARQALGATGPERRLADGAQAFWDAGGGVGVSVIPAPEAARAHEGRGVALEGAPGAAQPTLTAEAPSSAPPAR